MPLAADYKSMGSLKCDAKMTFFDNAEHQIFQAGMEGHLWRTAVRGAAAMVGGLQEINFEDDVVYLKHGLITPLVMAELASRHERDTPFAVRWVWMRGMPTPRGDYDYVYLNGDPGKRGSFKATIVGRPDAVRVYDVPVARPTNYLENFYDLPKLVADSWWSFRDSMYGS